MSNGTKRAIVVLSSGRAGTSLLMQVLGGLGMSLSERLIEGRYENPDGFFEDTDIVRLHKRIFAETGLKGVLPLPSGWLEADVVNNIRQELQRLVHRQLEQATSIWGFKDPRTCTFLPLWLKILNAEKVNPSFILAMRDPSSVISSFLRLYNISADLAELVWLCRTCDALHYSAADCYIVHYEDWFNHPARLGTELLGYTGLEPFFNGEVSEVLRDIIKPNLNRAKYDPYPIKNKLVLRLYDVIRQCNGAQFDRAGLMDVVRDCRESMEDFKGWYLDAQQSAKAISAFKRNSDLNRTRDVGRNMEKNELLAAQAQQDTGEVSMLKQQVRLLEQQLSMVRMEKENLQLEHRAERLEEQRIHAEELAALQIKVADTQAEHSTPDQRLEQLTHDLANLTELNAQYVKMVKSLHDENQRLRAKSIVAGGPAKKTAKPAGESRLNDGARANVSEGDAKKKVTHPPKGPQKKPQQQPKGDPRPLAKPSSNVTAGRKIPAKTFSVLANNPHGGSTRRARLVRKFKNDPHQYFADSKVFFLRPMKFLFKKKA